MKRERLGDKQLRSLLSPQRSAHAHSTVFDAGGYRVLFSTDDSAQLSGVDAILGPYWEASVVPAGPRDGRGVDWSVVSVESSEVRNVLKRGDRGKPLRLYGDFWGWQSWGDGFCLIEHQEPLEGAFVHLPAERTSYYVSGERTGCLTHVEHLIKYQVRKWLYQRGYQQLHGAMCVLDGRGILIVGGEGSGKTTLLCHLLARGAHYVGNDAVYIRKISCSTVVARAWPHIVRVGTGTVRDNHLLHSYRKRHPVWDSGGVINWSRSKQDGKFEFYFPVLRQMFPGLLIVGESMVDRVVFPYFDLAHSKSSARRTSYKSAVDRHFGGARSGSWLDDSGSRSSKVVSNGARTSVLDALPEPLSLQFGGSGTSPVEVLSEALKTHGGLDDRGIVGE